MRRGTWVVLVAALTGSWLLVPPGSAVAKPVARHDFRFLAVLATVPVTSPSTGVRVSAAGVETAIASCDVATVQTLASEGAAIPLTPSGPLAPMLCAVLAVRSVPNQRLLVAPLTGDPSLGVPAGLSGRDVKSASAPKPLFSQPSGVGYPVNVTLTPSGVVKFDALVAALYDVPHPGSNSPRNEVAIVIDGLAYSAPAFQTGSFSGPVQITGNFTSNQASQIAKLINQARKG